MIRRTFWPRQKHNEIVKWGFISLLLLMAVIMVNDVQSLMSGEFTLKSKHKTAAPAVKTAAVKMRHGVCAFWG